MHRNDILYREMGQRVRAHREAAGLTQETLARRIGLARTSITNIERGKQRILVHVLYDLADTFDVRPDALLPPILHESDAKIDERLPADLSADERQWVLGIVEAETEGED